MLLVYSQFTQLHYDTSLQLICQWNVTEMFNKAIKSSNQQQ